MKKKRYSDEKMVAILWEAEKTTVAEAAKKYGVSTASIYAWRKRFRTPSASASWSERTHA